MTLKKCAETQYMSVQLLAMGQNSMQKRVKLRRKSTLCRNVAFG